MAQDLLSWDSSAARWQPILNAREIPPRRAQKNRYPGIPVRARLEWERDGVELVDTEAVGWTSTLVRVTMNDRRWRFGAAWVPASDVSRR